MKWIITCLIICMSTACIKDTQCHREVNAQNQTMITCPRMDAVLVEERVEEPCFREGVDIICGDKRFDEQGKRLSDQTTSSNIDETPLSPLAPSTDSFSGAPTKQRSKCLLSKDQVRCPNGVVTSWDEYTIYEDGLCYSMLVTNIGPRIICQKKDHPTLVLVPDGYSDVVECVRLEGSILCTDGTSVVDDMLKDQDTCKMPRIEAIGDVAGAMACIAECEMGQCERCDEILQTRILCDEGTIFELPVGCYFPGGVVRVTDDDSAQDLLNRKCNTIRADVVIAPDKEDAPYIDARLFRALLETRVIAGSLIIERIDLPPNQADLDQYIDVLLRLPLAVVSNDLMIRFSKRVPYILTEIPLLVIGGSMNMEVHQDLEAIYFPKLKHVQGSMYISSNRSLEFMEFHSDLQIKGQFVLADNAALDPCDLIDWLTWSLDHANSVLIIQNGSKNENNCN